jgi:hypothetical protein
MSSSASRHDVFGRDSLAEDGLIDPDDGTRLNGPFSKNCLAHELLSGS